MSCTSVFDAFRYATEDLDQDVARTASYRSIWLNLIPRGTYPKNVGTNRSVFAIGNVEPTSGTGAWTPIDLSNQLGATGDAMDTPNEICTNNWTDVEYGFNEATYGPEISQLRGPVICKKDLLFSHDPDTFLAGYIEEIAKRAKREWERNLQFHHVALSRKASAIADFEGSFHDQTALTGLDCPTGELTQEMLEIVAQYLNEDGATTPDSNGFITWEDAGPIFSLYIGMSQSQRILRQNAELRQDYRWADPQNLIARIGAKRVIGNFRHIINQRPQRYTCSGGTFTEVQPYVNGSGATAPTKGTVQVINPAWRAAPYEAADVLSPLLFTSEVVPPTNAAGGVAFNPTNYMGEWEFVTGAFKWDSACEDPLEDRGRHYAEFIAAAKPNLAARFKYGYKIFYKRCIGNDVEITTCSS
jgi:hypothetical protein